MKKKTMVDLDTVCCMCGDVGIPDKLFRCSNCRSRFQHSYCSNYYGENAEAIETCDWCQCEKKSSSSSSRSTRSGERIERHAGKPRRYKLLKDVMC